MHREVENTGKIEVLITLSEAAKLLGVHPNTLSKWAREGRVRVIETPGGNRRIPLNEVLRLLVERQKG